MVRLEDAVIARLNSHGEKFEILVDPDLALEFKRGNPVNFNELIAFDKIFKDAGKDEEQSDSAINKVFATTDVVEVVKKILLQGEVQLTTEQRKGMREQRRKEIINSIARNAVNPQTSSPHPPQRIEHALDEAKIHIDELKSAEEQIPKILQEIRKLIPISMERLQLAVKIPAIHAGRVSPILHKYELKKEEWQKDGSLIAVLELPAGIKNELFAELNHVTKGDFESKILENKTKI